MRKRSWTTGPPLCAFHLRGKCKYAHECKFSHDAESGDKTKIPVCKFWLEGNCKFGGVCMFSHASADLDELTIQNAQILSEANAAQKMGYQWMYNPATGTTDMYDAFGNPIGGGVLQFQGGVSAAPYGAYGLPQAYVVPGQAQYAMMAGQPVPADPNSAQGMPGQPMPGQPMPGQPMQPHGVPVQPMPGQPIPGQPMAQTGMPMPGHSQGTMHAGQQHLGQPQHGHLQHPPVGQPGQPMQPLPLGYAQPVGYQQGFQQGGQPQQLNAGWTTPPPGAQQGRMQQGGPIPGQLAQASPAKTLSGKRSRFDQGPEGVVNPRKKPRHEGPPMNPLGVRGEDEKAQQPFVMLLKAQQPGQ